MMRGNAHIVIGSIAFAVLLWLSVTMGGSFKSELKVPLVVTDIPSTSALASNLPPYLDVNVRGTGWQLLFLHLGQPVRYEISARKFKNVHVFLTNKYLSDLVRLPPGVTALRAYPDTLYLNFEKFIEKKVPIKLVAKLSYAENFGPVSAPQLVPAMAKINGAKSIVSLIKFWPTKRIVLDDISKPLRMEIELEDSLSSLVNVYPRRVLLKINVEQMAEDWFGPVAVTIKHVPRDKEVMLAQPSVRILVRAGISKLNTLRVEDFKAVVNYGDLISGNIDAFRPEISAPAGTMILRVDPEEIPFTIRETYSGH
ncbi:MAG: hypothetical protein GXO82_01615 [Chlorobi bacterium]|nr:hypothetical protein [Chlorobiota bacterium]